jgi:hypothetical protein
LFVDSNGKVGIGTATAADDAVLTVTKGTNIAYPGQNNAQLHINNSTGAAGILIASSTLNNIFFADAAANNVGRIYYDHSSDFLAFHTNSSERMRLDSSGRLGLGTSSPSATLHVVGTGLFTGSTQFNNGIQLKAATQNYIYFDDALSFTRNGVGDRLTIDSSGRVGIGTTSALYPLDVRAANAGSTTYINVDNTSATATSLAGIYFSQNGTPKHSITAATFGADYMAFNIGAGGSISERARIDSSGRLLVGTSSTSRGDFLQVQADSSGTTNGGSILLRSGKATGTITTGDVLGQIRFSDSSQDIYATIQAVVDGSTGSNDFPSRLVFSTTADGASSPTERMRISQKGAFKVSTDGTYVNVNDAFHEFVNSNSNNQTLITWSKNASFASRVIEASVNRAANTAYSFFTGISGAYSAEDSEFILRGDGNAFADGSWSGGGADYAEYFEWSDSNPNAEDRRGISVVLDGDKIREAQAGEDPIGVISGNPSVVGDAAWNKWSGKYLRDEFGTYIQEDYEVTDDDGNTVIQQRRKLNPAYDPDVEYISREQRPEWDCVGLMGKLRIRKGQVTGSRWIKMRDISATVEEWLVR